MPTRIPGTGAMLTNAVEWETLLEYLERLRATVAAGDETVRALDGRAQRLETRLKSLENIISLPTWRRADEEPRPGLLAALDALAARVARLEATTEAGVMAVAADIEGLFGIVRERLKERLGRQVEDIHVAVHRPGERPRQVGAGLAAMIAELERTVRAQGEALGRWQGGTASVSGALAELRKQVAALERRHEAIEAALRRLDEAQRACGDRVAQLVVQQGTNLDGNDALTLLTRLLASPAEIAPLFRRDQFVCFSPERVQRWLIDAGLSRREAGHARSVWRDAGYVPSERNDNHNKRVKVAGAASPPYFVVVPTLTYAKLRVPIPPGLPTEPPVSRARGSAG
jgi:hypothetical protein